MIYKYRVAHKCTASSHGSREGASSTDARLILQGHALFHRRLLDYFRSLPQLFSDVRASDPTQEGVDVYVDSHLDTRSVENLVTSLLSDVNHEHPGLHLTAAASPESRFSKPTGR